MPMIRLTNRFHRTSFKTRKSLDEVAAIRQADPDRLTPAQREWISTVRRRLCGVKGCTCATTPLGER